MILKCVMVNSDWFAEHLDFWDIGFEEIIPDNPSFDICE